MPSEPVHIACPLCGSPLTPTPHGWACIRWGPSVGGCTFSIRRWYQGRRLYPTDLAKLCEGGVLAWPRRTGVMGWYYIDIDSPQGMRWVESDEAPEPRWPARRGVRQLRLTPDD